MFLSFSVLFEEEKNKLKLNLNTFTFKMKEYGINLMKRSILIKEFRRIQTCLYMIKKYLWKYKSHDQI